MRPTNDLPRRRRIPRWSRVRRYVLTVLLAAAVIAVIGVFTWALAYEETITYKVEEIQPGHFCVFKYEDDQKVEEPEECYAGASHSES